jgi:hypothetical protein
MNELQAETANSTQTAFATSTAIAADQKWIGDMSDQSKTNPTNRREEAGSTRSANCIPGSKGDERHKNRYLDITAMIRSLQRTEGLSDCFRRGIADCDQLHCSWRQYCLEQSEDLSS